MTKNEYIIEGLSLLLEAEGYNVPLLIYMCEKEWSEANGKPPPRVTQACITGVGN